MVQQYSTLSAVSLDTGISLVSYKRLRRSAQVEVGQSSGGRSDCTTLRCVQLVSALATYDPFCQNTTHIILVMQLGFLFPEFFLGSVGSGYVSLSEQECQRPMCIEAWERAKGTCGE